ncbi:MAG: dCTP deaminase, partial [Candidatus Heimdallarchaeota archaeon]
MIVPRGKFLKEVVIIPTPDEYQANIAAVDLRIGQKSFDPHTGNENETLEDRTIQIYSGKHFLIQTLEYFEIPNDVMGVVYPRSGTNRKGITLDMTGVVDPGYKGHLMLPITNLTDGVIEFHPGERIAQICFHRIEAYTEVP